MTRIAYREFLGDSPNWFKLSILVFLVLCFPLKMVVGTTVIGWMFLGMFILTLAMALKCYPLQSGGLLGLGILALGLTSPETVWHEIQANLGVLALLIFMVSFIYFMKPLLTFVFAKLIVNVRSKWMLSLVFSVMAAFLSAFLDALTVTAVLIAVFVALYGVYEKTRSANIANIYHDGASGQGVLSDDSLEKFRAFVRSLVMHGAIGTALGGVTTMVGEPQNLLIADKMGWDFIQFAQEMSHVTIPAVIAGFLTCIALELTGILGYGAKLDPQVRSILKGYIQEEDEKRTQRETYGLVVQGICGVLLVIGLALHIMEVGLIGLCLLVAVTALTGINKEHQIGHAFEESLPFVSLLCIWYNRRRDDSF